MNAGRHFRAASLIRHLLMTDCRSVCLDARKAQSRKPKAE
jgi:hypothetical protein